MGFFPYLQAEEVQCGRGDAFQILRGRPVTLRIDLGAAAIQQLFQQHQRLPVGFQHVGDAAAWCRVQRDAPPREYLYQTNPSISIPLS